MKKFDHFHRIQHSLTKIVLIIVFVMASCVSFDGNENQPNKQQHSILENETIAVLPFENTGLEDFECEAITLFFENSLIKNNNQNVLERTQIDKVIETYKLSYSGIVDESSSNEIGNMLDAHYIVLGNLGLFSDEYYINVKIIEVETGLCVGSSKYSASTVDSLVNHIDDVVFELFGKQLPNKTVTEKIDEISEKKCINTWIKYALKGNQSYDKDDYETSYMFYTYAIRNGCFDGLVWYRYAYSFEQLYGTSDISNSNYCKSLLLLSTQYTENVYYQYAKKKVETYKG